MGTAVSVGATFMSPACVRHCVPPFFIRMCGNRRQRRGDIHVARVGALLHCAVFSSVRVETAVSVGATFMSPAWVRHCVVCAPSWHDDVCLTALVPGVINGAPTGYATVRSWWPAVFSSVHVGTAGSVGATFMSPASVRCCAACASGTSGPWVCAARVRAVVSRRCLPLRSCTGRHKWRPYVEAV